MIRSTRINTPVGVYPIGSSAVGGHTLLHRPGEVRVEVLKVAKHHVPFLATELAEDTRLEIMASTATTAIAIAMTSIATASAATTKGPTAPSPWLLRCCWLGKVDPPPRPPLVAIFADNGYPPPWIYLRRSNAAS